MAIAPGEGITKKQATAATNAAKKVSAPAKPKAPAPAKTPVKTPAPTQTFTGTPFGQSGSYVDTMGTPFGQAGSASPSGKSTLEDYAYNTNQKYDPLTGKVISDTVNDNSKVPAGPSTETRDAFETMGLLLKQWGLDGLADTYGRLMTQGLSAAEALTKLKYDKTIDPVTGKPWNTAYNTRFKGNELRVAAGMNAYDEATYLDVENSYDETLRKYGLSNMVKADKAAAQAQYADYMAKGIAPTEFAERIQTVADRVINMDPSIKAQFQTYYPSLTNTDLVSYFLDPKETLPVLKNKVTAAEIGAVADAAKYGIGESRAMELAKFGVTRNEALAGYQNIAEVTPTANKLSGIYNEEGIAYGQTQAEDEYLKQDAQAKLKRNRLASKERAMFQGQSGVDTGSLVRGSFGTI